MKKEVNAKRIILVGNIVLIAIGLLVYIIAQRTENFMMDDIWYSTKLFNDEPITSLKDIWEAQIWHYNNWGGRSMTHTLLQIILLAGENVADVLNVLVTIVLAYMMAVVAGNKKVTYVLGAASLVIGCNANWRMSMFWQSGAANYLYITVAILFFLFCYLRRIPEEGTEWETKKDLPGIYVYILPLGLIAGWSNENMGPAAWILSTLIIVMLAYRKVRIRVWMILGNLSCLVGSILVVVAPGNFVRSAEVATNNYGKLWQLYLRCYAEGKAALEFLFPILVILMLMIVTAKVLDIRIGCRNLLLLLTALLSWGAMVLSPHYPDRATFGTLCLIICVILSLAGKIYKAAPKSAIWLWSAMAVVWLRSMYVLVEYLGIRWGWIL